MRTTVTLDEELVAKAATLTGIEEHSVWCVLPWKLWYASKMGACLLH